MKKVSIEKKEELIEILKAYNLSNREIDKKNKDIAVRLLKENPQSCEEVLNNLEFKELGKNMIRYILSTEEVDPEYDSLFSVEDKDKYFYALLPNEDEIKEFTQCMAYDCAFEIMVGDFNKYKNFSSEEIPFIEIKGMKRMDDRYNHKESDVKDLLQEYQNEIKRDNIYTIYKENRNRHLFDIISLAIDGNKNLKNFKLNDDKYYQPQLTWGEEDNDDEDEKGDNNELDFYMEEYDLLLLVNGITPLLSLTRLYLLRFFKTNNIRYDDITKKFNYLSHLPNMSSIELDARNMLLCMKESLKEGIEYLLNSYKDSIYPNDIVEKDGYEFQADGVYNSEERIVIKRRSKYMIAYLLWRESDCYNLQEIKSLEKMVNGFDVFCKNALKENKNGENRRKIFSFFWQIIYQSIYAKNKKKKIKIEEYMRKAILIRSGQ